MSTSPPRYSEPPDKTLQSIPIASLPDDLQLSCLARVSRLYHPTLSLVSKTFRSLLASSELYKTRSRLDCTESCLYVCLQFPDDPTPCWFTLCRRPDRIRKDSCGNLLIPIPSSPQSLPVHASAHVALGSDIYEIVGLIDDAPSSSVWMLDCRNHTRSKAPNMRVERDHPAANAIDGKIYVAGGCRDFNSSNWIEVFDPRTQTWNPLSSPGAEMCGSEIIVSTEIDGKAYMYGCKGVAYNPKDGTCEPVEWNMCKGFAWYTHCVIENVLYSYFDGKLHWYDTKLRVWRILQGLKGLPKFATYHLVKLVNYGGKMAVLWDKYGQYQGKTIWCAVIAVERRNNEEIWGTVEWIDSVLPVPESYKFLRVLAVTV